MIQTKSSKRLTQDDWLAMGRDLIRQEGGHALTLERLCQFSGKTRGSFYHHFDGTGDYLNALLVLWRETATERIISATQTVSDPASRRETLSSLADSEDHRFEAGLRALSVSHPDVAAAIEAVDARREGFISQLIGEEFNMPETEARAVGRVIYGLFLMGQLRAPEDLRAFISDGSAWILGRLTQSRLAPQ